MPTLYQNLTPSRLCGFCYTSKKCLIPLTQGNGMPGGGLMNKPNKRSSHENAEETRRKILRFAQQLFMENGYRAVTTRHIADACGLTQPALYHHFTDKEEIYLEMVKEEVTTIHLSLGRIVDRDIPVAERLMEAAIYLFRNSHYDVGLLIHDIRYQISENARTILDQQFHQSFILPLQSLFQEGMQSKILRDQTTNGMSPTAITYLFLTMLSSYSSQYRRMAISPHFQAENHTQYARQIITIFLYGLLVDPEDAQKSGA